ncbi:DUF5988 family protein [Streptomyces formicae]|uniref:Uncharacterized protein n=1 Tax=Streptomyces formicae TaxID=1616117 RepID=A0ABY3WKL4_9ACTN|nr:DUF5988 family protein [Streptomyces formicae]UNM11887.1 hypothetical protein J4032_10325 [Streptomyces formicae]
MTASQLVLLQGGPDDLPQVWPLPPGGCGEPVKIPRYNAYEHFEFAHEHRTLDGESMPVYRWTYRTYIAE